MAIKITGDSTSATVASVKLRASVSAVIPTVGTTRVYPVAEVAYIFLAVGAYLDTSGLFRFTGETIGADDSLVLSFSKPFADAVVFLDTPALSFVTAKAETISASDGSVLALALGKTETISIADTNALAFTFGIVAEDVAASDLSILSTQKPVADTVSFSDATLVTLIFLRDFFDTVTLADTAAFSFVPDTKVEAVTSGDSNSYVFDQFLTEAFAMNDLADVGDGISFEFIDFTANVVTITEAAVINTAPSATDSFSLSDAGVGSIQDYCDITYFAEDYVGIQFTF